MGGVGAFVQLNARCGFLEHAALPPGHRDASPREVRQGEQGPERAPWTLTMHRGNARCWEFMKKLYTHFYHLGAWAPVASIRL